MTEQATTGLETPHARPRATFDGTKTYGVFYRACKTSCVQNFMYAKVVLMQVRWMHTLSSHRRGRCKRMARGSVSAANTTNSDIPRLSVLVPGGAKQGAKS